MKSVLFFPFSFKGQLDIVTIDVTATVSSSSDIDDVKG